tara:strand:- start:1837 stop:2454 length:618 start_codon:yes stop_codon:yes gene_type:complete
MQPVIHELFPTPLFESRIQVQQQWVDVVKNVPYERGYDPNWTSVTKEILQLPELSDLNQEITGAAGYFAYNGLGVAPNIEVYISRSWSVKHNPCDRAAKHCHSNSIWSGIYYMTVTPESGDVLFDKGNFYPNCFLPTIDPDCFENEFTRRQWRYTPSTGSLLIFPSQLLHDVLPNESSIDRYCIAFDIFIRGEFGFANGNGIRIN